MNQTIRITTDTQGVATVTLNVPKKHNAMSAAMIAEMTDAATALSNDPDIRVVVLTGAGASFCAGGDLNWMQTQMAGDDEMRADAAKSIAMMLYQLNTMPKPLIGRINGNAFGGGVGLASVCDVVVADSTAKFGLTETRLGLIPATIGPYVIARMGEGRARRVFMSSRIFDVNEAIKLGLVHHQVRAKDIDDAVAGEIAPYLSCSPNAVGAAKALARSLGPIIDDAVIQKSINALVAQWQTPDAAEGIAAFFEKRAPTWVK